MIQKQWQGLIKPYRVQVVGSDCAIGRMSEVVAEPLERGFGVTLGNALRRVLLSSLKGAAVTSIRIDGIVHEFSTIAGVLEDITDIILNVKSMSLKMDGEGSRKMRISVKGPCAVTAGMFELGSELKVLNPDHYICTVEENITFTMEMEVAVGRGYVPSVLNREDGAPVGTLFIDSIFNPVKKVSYRVESTRVNQVTDYDRLIMEVETNGSISPEDAVAMSARILQDQFQKFVNFEDEMETEEEKEQSTPFNTNLSRKVEDLELSVRSMNCLKNDNIVYIGDLVKKTENEMLRTPNFGRKSLNEIKEVLSQMGLYLGMQINDWSFENIEDVVKKPHSNKP
ncbi:MAG: DNA-directed RNA polymerase subunit alpha [Holosporaceae bacterium]|jgi:DNA-directed RNA polymerase subunit alpha|nr:DNA-directed RNA polymerase subunit alpha [Holosporaceae bacterium]